MLTSRDRQRSFYDADSVCEQLIPEDSFYRKFREVVAPLIDDSMQSLGSKLPPTLTPAGQLRRDKHILRFRLELDP